MNTLLKHFQLGIPPFFKVKSKSMSPRKQTLSAQPTLFDSGHKAEIDPEVLYAEYLHKTHSTLVPYDQKKLYLNGLTNEFECLFTIGDKALLAKPSVSVVGTRTPSADGESRAFAVAKCLVDNDFVVMSGLAKGIDTIAHTTALRTNGKTIAVLGTPIHKIYPAQNKKLGLEIGVKGLLLSPSLPHEEMGKFLFPRRNRLMARLSIATVIVEAGPTSGVVHQGAECLRQKKKLILLRSVAENGNLPWVTGFIKSGALIADGPQHLISLLKK